MGLCTAGLCIPAADILQSSSLERVETVNDCEAVVVGHAETLKTYAGETVYEYAIQ